MLKALTQVLWAGAILAVAAAPAVAQEDFYRGKRITFLVGSGAGGAYDFATRLLSEHMPRHIPGNPSAVVQNMPGAGSRIAMNYIATKGPKDGTLIGLGTNLLPFDQFVFPEAQRQYDLTKFHYIGNMAKLNSIIAVWHTVGVTTFEQAKTKEVILGAASRVSESYIAPAVINAISGTKFKIVHGFPGNISEIDLAIERGEVQGRGSTWSSFKVLRPDWIREKRVIPILQIGSARLPDLPDVPLLTELAENDEQRAIFSLLTTGSVFNRAYKVAAEVPADRVAMLRKAFMDTMKDEQFLSIAKSKNVEVSPSTHEELAKLLNDVKAMAKPEYLEKIRPILQQE